jgi:hypothetical protein
MSRLLANTVSGGSTTRWPASAPSASAPMDVKIGGDVRGQSRNCGPTTQLRIFATLRVRQRRIAWNPCVGVELEHPETAERRRWTPAEVVSFLDSTADDEMGLMSRIAGGPFVGCAGGSLP